MRKKFEQQMSVGILPMGEVKIREKSRHQVVPLLKALQYVFVTGKLIKEDTREESFAPTK